MQREDKRISELEQIDKYPNQDDLLIIFNREAGEAGETQSMPFSRLPEGGGAKVTSINGRTDNVVLDKDDVGLGNVDNTSDMDKPVSVAVLEKFDESIHDLISSTQYPIFTSHRGGLLVYPESSIEGFIASVNSGFALEFDVSRLSDGNLAIWHDQLVQPGHIIGLEGSLDSISLQQWLSGRISSPVDGGDTGTPTTLDYMLDRFGGLVPLFIEIKPSANTEVGRIIEIIKQRGLSKSVVLQSFSLDICAAASSAGIYSLFGLTNTINVPVKDIVDAGVSFVSVREDMTHEDRLVLRDEGIGVLAYTVNSPSRARELLNTGSVDGLHSDDPWFVSNRVHLRSSDSFGEGVRPQGLQVGQSGSGYSNYSISGGRIISRGGTNPGNLPIYLNDMENVKTPFRIEAKFRRGPANGLQSAGVGFVLFKNEINPLDDWLDAASPGQSVITAHVRRNGQMSAWKSIDGGTSTSIGASTVPSTPVAAESKWGEYTFILEHTGSVLRLQVPELNYDFSVNDTTTLDNLRVALRLDEREWVEVSGIITSGLHL